MQVLALIGTGVVQAFLSARELFYTQLSLGPCGSLESLSLFEPEWDFFSRETSRSHSTVFILIF